MFREFNGLPLHVLVIHAVVVLVPLLALFAIAYGVLPRWRHRLDWAVAALAVITPAAAWVATESGEELEGILRAKGYPPDRLQQISEHASYGDTLFWYALGLGAAALLLVLSTSRFVAGRNLPRWLPILLTVAVAVLAGFALVYVYLTGDSGAKMVWDGIV
ncbi:DUF2231 domain-containing protein [Micromonospora chalcea]|uniref:Cytochrome c biogenesis protein CcdA n=1 Tax=Micromonospora echinospora TaxID=1877 RepID=A0ABR6M7T1_MICEC|nr:MULTISPECIES: DUF2231 domain-containing protein [Micromonospora]AXO33044.1 hypothetical protein MicB006_0738 [Micromonospora sp. B006]MBB5111445.1 cytochrome c biogenesis protein CcdA [Micromonospora echinospora]OKJ48007.1 hypothetical protein AMK25_01775 [Micromonospora sp. TSRI0369]